MAEAKRRLKSMISVRFLPIEEQQVRRTAAQRGLSVSDFIRRAAVSATRRPSIREHALPSTGLAQSVTVALPTELRWYAKAGR